MKFFFTSAILLLLANSHTSIAQSCSGSRAFDGLPITLDYALSYDEASSDSSVAFKVVYEGLGWVSWALSPNGRMTNSLAVIGLPADGTVDTYSLAGKSNNLVFPTTDTEIVLSDSSITQNDTHTVLAFTASNSAPFDTLEIDPLGSNIFLVAVGSGNSLGYHRFRGGGSFPLAPCATVPAVTTTAVTTSETATPATTTATETTNTTVVAANFTYVVADTNATDASHENEMDPDNAQSCSFSHIFDGLPITLDYTLSYDEATSDSSVAFKVIYEGLGWVSWALSPNGRMTNSLAVIGLPEEGMVDTYSLAGRSNNLVFPTTDTEIVLSDSSITQNDTHTVLAFTASNSAPFDTLEIDPLGSNIFLVAVGSGNSLGYHRFRGGDRFPLAPCATVPAVTTTAVTTSENATSATPATTTATETINTTGVAANSTDVVTDANTTDASNENDEMDHDDAQLCSFSHVFDRLPITLDYTLSYDEATSDSSVAFKVVYEGIGWVSWALSPNGRMTNSLAVIGLPEDGTVDTYSLAGKSNNLVFPTTDTEIVLSDSSITQNDTHTVLAFTASNSAPFDTLEIDPLGSNIFLVAVGSGNSLGYHRFRGGDSFPLAPCTAVPAATTTALTANEAATTTKTARTATTTGTKTTDTIRAAAKSTDVTTDTTTTYISDERDDMDHDEEADDEEDDSHNGMPVPEDESTSGAMYYTSGVVVGMFSIFVLQVAL